VSEPVRPLGIKASDVRVGDRLRSSDGTELTVTRIDERFLGLDGMLAFVEDSAAQWFKMPAQRDGEVQLLRRGVA
jgi:hypothetical protein